MVGKSRKKRQIQDYMSPQPVTIESETSAFDIANKMLAKKVSSVIVVDRGKPIGILTERDLTRQVCANDSPPRKTPAASIMSTPLVSVDKNLAIEKAADVMLKNNVRHLAVVEGKKIVGVITTTDFSRYLVDKLSGTEHVSRPALQVLYSLEEPTEENT